VGLSPKVLSVYKKIYLRNDDFHRSLLSNVAGITPSKQSMTTLSPYLRESIKTPLSRFKGFLFLGSCVQHLATWILKSGLNAKKPLDFSKGFRTMWRRPTLPGVTPVPSALQGLTSLFGMGRGGTPALGRLNLCRLLDSRDKIQDFRLWILYFSSRFLLLVSCF
jgi:hypothetical protein